MGSCDSYTGLDETSWCHISAKITAADTLYSISSATHTCNYSVCVYIKFQRISLQKKSGKKCNFICNIKKTGYTQKNSGRLL